MKKKTPVKSVKQTKTENHNFVWLLLVFAFGWMLGYTTHYTISNWDRFFSETMKCEDGSRPDKNGCCAGEIYTDAGGGWMVCCPDGGDNCFPPIK